MWGRGLYIATLVLTLLIRGTIFYENIQRARRGGAEPEEEVQAESPDDEDIIHIDVSRRLH